MLALAGLLLALAIVMAGCGGQGQPPAGSTGSFSSSSTAATGVDSSDAQGDSAAGARLPEFITMSTYDQATTTYVQMAAMSEGMLRKTGIQTRHLPAGNDPGRLKPVMEGQAHMGVFTGATVYLANAAIGDFGTPEWGPQGLLQIWGAMPDYGLTLITAADANIHTPYDSGGKRFPYVPGGTSFNLMVEALLAFGNLTVDDVELVTVPAIGQAYTGLAEGIIDGSPGTTPSPPFYDLEQSRRGIHLPEFPPEDTEGWARMQAVAPFTRPVRATQGAGGLSPETPRNLVGYPNPIIVAYPELPDEIAYAYVKAIHESFDEYKDAVAGMETFELERAITTTTMMAPYHPGAVKYFKEIGHWNDELEEKHRALLAEQEQVKRAWDEFMSQAGGMSQEEFARAWEERRKQLQ